MQNMNNKANQKSGVQKFTLMDLKEFKKTKKKD